MAESLERAITASQADPRPPSPLATTGFCRRALYAPKVRILHSLERGIRRRS